MGRLLHLLALVASMLTPAAMHAAPAAPAHHQAAAPDHCAGGEQRPDEGDRPADCAIACSAMPCAAATIAVAEVPRLAFVAATSPFFAGIAPGSDPPPPRLS